MATTSVATGSNTLSLDKQDAANEALYQAKGVTAVIMAAMQHGEGFNPEEMNGALWVVHRLIDQAKSLLDQDTEEFLAAKARVSALKPAAKG